MSNCKKKKLGYTIVKKHTIIYEWMVNEISSYIKSSYNSQKNVTIFSPKFSVDSEVKDLWKLHMRFNGQSSKSKDYISVFLQSLNSQRRLKATVVYFVLNNKRERIVIQKFSKEYEALQRLGYQRYLKKSELLEKKDVFTPYNTLTLGVELSVFDDHWTISTSGPFDKAKRLMTSDYKNLFQTKMESDVTFIVQDKKFQAHKLVLMVRSPVFQAMLNKNMRENKENVITISDINPEMFNSMLEFMYTDEVTELNTIAEDLLDVADKYQIQTLKQMCVESLCLSVNIENAARFILLADRYNAEVMLKYITEYIGMNAENVVQTQGYKLMEAANPYLALTIFKNFSTLKIKEQLPG